METIGDWLGRHTLTLSFLTLVASGIISVFSGDIRQFLKLQPQKLNVWILKARLNAATTDLERLRALNDHTSVFVAYAAIAIVLMLLGIFAFIVGEFTQLFRLLSLQKWSTGDRILLTIFMQSGLLIMAAASATFSWKIRRLQQYENSIRKAEAKIGKLREKLKSRS